MKSQRYVKATDPLAIKVDAMVKAMIIATAAEERRLTNWYRKYWETMNRKKEAQAA